jgi:hypothetical protein
MPLYLDPATGTYPVTVAWLRWRHPNTSFPHDLTPQIAQAFGLVEVTPTPQPHPTDIEGSPHDNGNGTWSQTWAAAPSAPAPTTPQMSPLVFMGRLSTDETTAIATAAQQNPAIFLWMLQAAAASYIDVTDQRTIEGVNALAQAGLIQPSRVAALLAPAPVA